MAVRFFAAAGQLPRLVRRKVSMLLAFTVGLSKKFKELSFTSRGSARLIDALAQLLAGRSLL